MTVSLTSVSFLAPDARPIVRELTAHFGAERTGLVGRNGIGKSTVLRLIAGELRPSSGSVQVEGRCGWLDQDLASLQGHDLPTALGVSVELARLARIERGEGDAADFDAADWTLPERIEEALRLVGLARLPGQRLADFSAGQRTRVALARLELERPDVLLLDEPTNHLDRDGREAVRALLRRHRGCVVVVSHDRELLDEVDAIVELSALGAQRFGGNYSHYAQRKQLEREAAEHKLEGASRALDEVRAKAQEASERKARRDSRGRADALRGGAPKILLGARKDRSEDSGGSGRRLAERRREQAEHELSEARAKVEIVRDWRVELAPSGASAGRTVLQLQDVEIGYQAEHAPQLQHVNLLVRGGERLALEGANGAGKSTLLRLLAGQLSPRAGSLSRSPRFALLDQHHSLLELSLSVRENFHRLHPGSDENACRASLARFLFRGEAAERRGAELSYGERARAALACVLGGAQPPELLLLDEPTNHLDLASTEAVEQALRSYDGAVIAVSHDAAFLAAIEVQRWLRVEAGRLHEESLAGV